ncbi:MAG: hypothetical protein K1W20_09075 [Lachnospiraceae bacterium]
MVVDEILDGKFHVDDGSLEFSCPRVTLSLQADTACEGSFFVYGPEGGLTEGEVFSSDLRMECVSTRFGGSEDEILYRFHADGMEAGTEAAGSFHIFQTGESTIFPLRLRCLRTKLSRAWAKSGISFILQIWQEKAGTRRSGFFMIPASKRCLTAMTGSTMPLIRVFPLCRGMNIMWKNFFWKSIKRNRWNTYPRSGKSK